MSELKRVRVYDFETYYDPKTGYTLSKMTPPEYILDPRFEVILLAVYDLSWPAPKILLPHEISEFLAKYPADEEVAIAHNMLFDGPILAWKYNYVPGALQDTLGMARALLNLKKNSLGAVAKALFGHDSKGDTVHKVAGMRTQDIKNAGLWPSYCTYAMNDTSICARAAQKMYDDFPEEERRVMDLVLRCAVEPTLQVDQHMLQLHLNDIRKEKARLLQECGFDRAALMSTAQFKQALEDLGVEIKTKVSAAGNTIPQFSKSDPFMHELQAYDQADEGTNTRVQTLAMARLSHKSTIEETRCQKFLNISMLPWPNKQPLLPVPLRYGGAHTHRLSGEWRMNLQNLPRDKSKSKLRSALHVPAGFKMITADLAQIEARIVAKICGQDTLIEEFKQGDVYASFASKVFGRTVTKKDNPNERFIGKTAILGLGYGCGHERFNQMVVTQARQYGIPLEGLFDEQTAMRTVNTYRAIYPRIPATWRQLDQLLANVINAQGDATATWGPLTFKSGRIKLPNGMYLRYQVGDQSLYGAKLLENCVQALARIVVMSAGVRLAQRGLRFVAQSHDELVFVVPDRNVEEFSQIISEEMTKEPTWMPGLPLAVEVGVGDDYGACK